MSAKPCAGQRWHSLVLLRLIHRDGAHGATLRGQRAGQLPVNITCCLSLQHIMQTTLVNVQAVSGQGEVLPRGTRKHLCTALCPQHGGLSCRWSLVLVKAAASGSAGDGRNCAACSCTSTIATEFQLPAGGKGTNPKTTLYVGGLEENVNEAILNSAFIPFGEIKDVNIPLDHATGG